MQHKKVRVMVLYGGRSGEHEVSLQSAASVIRNLDPNRFEVVPVAIDKQGRWLLNDLSLIDKGAKSLAVFKNAPSVVLPPNPGGAQGGLVSLTPGANVSRGAVDVVFPVMHGPLCEDGAIQGLLDLADVAYVGCGILASAVGMDKDVAKRLAQAAGIAVVPWVALKQDQWNRSRAEQTAKIEKTLGYPCFVKPANLGSSVGVHKVKEAGQLAPALEDSFRYDVKVLVEKAVDAREIEISVLENPADGTQPLVSVPGEIIPKHEFYSYEAKYLDENGAVPEIPAKISAEQTAGIQRIARQVFLALECEGMSRVDFFLEKNGGRIYFNEINTIPGFTQISMYPKMWEASGISYQELLSRLVDLALARHERRRRLVRDFSEGNSK